MRLYVAVSKDTSTARGTLFGVSVGPGDPELVTLKAVRTIREADAVAVPTSHGSKSIAYDIAREHVRNKPVMRCSIPMSKDPQVTARAHAEAANMICERLDAGDDVAYLCLGDISLYASFHHVAQVVIDRGYQVSVVPGVPSFCAAAATMGQPLCMGDERLLIAPLAVSKIDELLDVPANKVFVKPREAYPALRDKLAERGQKDGAFVVSNCGLPGESVIAVSETDDVDYLSVVVVPDYRAH